MKPYSSYNWLTNFETGKQLPKQVDRRNHGSRTAEEIREQIRRMEEQNMRSQQRLQRQ